MAKLVSGETTLYNAQFKQLKDIIFSPHLLIAFLFTPQHIIIPFLTLLYYGFFPIIEFPLFIVAIPVFYMNYLIFHGPTAVLMSSYGLVHIVPIVSFAAILGFDKLRKLRLFLKDPKLVTSMNAFLLSSIFISYLFFNPFRYQMMYWPERFQRFTQHDIEIYKYLISIPKKFSICCDEHYRFVLGNRREIYVFDVSATSSEKSKYPQIKDSDMVIVSQNANEDFKRFIKDRLLNSNDYGVEKYFEGIVVFKKGLDKKFKDVVKENRTMSPVSNSIRFNDELELLSYHTDKNIYRRNNVVKVTLFWKVIKDIERDYWFVVRMKKFGKTIQEVIWEPFSGFFPTSLWENGNTYKEEINLPIPEIAILSYEPVFLEIYAVDPLTVKNNSSFLNSLGKFQTIKEKKEPISQHFFGMIQLVL
ncbi:MAG: hypothetical protein FJZ16_10295 [Candidatus Omnitrophica bacterium]|nr:hypothetical protein [Candidatus Omnitrophota bacterium]